MSALRSPSPSVGLGSAVVITAALALAAGALAADPTGAGEPSRVGRTTAAFTFLEGTPSRVELAGGTTTDGAGVRGRADVTRRDGRTHVRLRLGPLPHPQSLGAFYTTYLLWAVGPEGRFCSLAELSHSRTIDVEVTTSFQAFGLVVSAEPHSAVARPSPQILAETRAPEGGAGDALRTRTAAYAAVPAALYETSGPDDPLQPDFATPLPVLGARRALDVARRAGARQHAGRKLHEAEVRQASVERAWPRRVRLPADVEAQAREVARLAEHARLVSEEAAEQRRLTAEGRDRTSHAEAELIRAQEEIERAWERAAQEQARAVRARVDAERARDRRQARPVLSKRLARTAAPPAHVERPRPREEPQAPRHQARPQERLYASLSRLLDTRRQAGGLSDLFFDFDRTSLTTGARQKLAALAEVLLAYPGRYRIDVEGYTDAIGSPEYNLALSVGRARNVRGCLLVSGLPAARFGGAVGFGEERPVAGNDSDAGRRKNRRVEVIVSGLEDQALAAGTAPVLHAR